MLSRYYEFYLVITIYWPYVHYVTCFYIRRQVPCRMKLIMRLITTTQCLGMGFPHILNTSRSYKFGIVYITFHQPSSAGLTIENAWVCSPGEKMLVSLYQPGPLTLISGYVTSLLQDTTSLATRPHNGIHN